MSAQPVNPPTLAPPHGYAHGMVAAGRILTVAGQIGWDQAGRLVSSEFVPQFDRALANVLAVVRQAGGGPRDLMLLRLYVTDKQQYSAQRKEVGRVYREQMGDHYPAMALVQVADLLEPGALVEIEGLAVLS